jgi:hypothetical protein
MTAERILSPGGVLTVERSLGEPAVMPGVAVWTGG